ncbi:GNAT family N-acetyltransferase [Streptomyces sp. NPDC006704]|uniref:GNAT family N-acetyltransferase n=1 Tax=Streptomyces sp. NPDC006704 TaxID=3364760 RepID=UPI003685100E
MSTIRTAAPGDGTSVARLYAIAMGTDDAPDPTSPMIQAIEGNGGLVPVPFGTAHCIVAEAEGDVVGMIHAAPPVQWLQDLPGSRAKALAHRILQVELLAVDAGSRGAGLGQRLLEAVEARVRDQQGYLVIGKVRAGDFTAMRYYRRRGYIIAGKREPVVFQTTKGGENITVLDDEFHLFAKAVQPGTALHRDRSMNCIYLVAE